MSDIFREVDEEVRQDKAKEVWKKYGIHIMGLAVLIVVCVGSFKAWQYYSVQKLEQAGADYLNSVTLIDNGKDADALEAFQVLSKKGTTGFYLLSKFQEAGLLAKTGKNDDALEIYDALAGNSALENNLRDLAKLRAGLLLSNTSSFTEVEARVGDLAKTGNSWRHSALEVLAVTAFRTGDLVKADQFFNQLSADLTTPSSMRVRAAAMSSIITPQLPAKTPKKQETKPDAQ